MGLAMFIFFGLLFFLLLCVVFVFFLRCFCVLFRVDFLDVTSDGIFVCVLLLMSVFSAFVQMYLMQ